MKLKPLESSLFDKLDPAMQVQLRASGVVPVADPIYPLWNLPEGTRTVVLIGGRGGMKTYGVSEFIAYQAAVNKKRCAILRDEKERIKETILNEVLLRFDQIPFQTDVDRLDTGLKDKTTNESIVFTMGFKASDSSKTANMKGVSNIDIAVIEEAEDIRDVTKFNNFTDGLRKEGCLVIIILNTPDIGHWVLKRYFKTNIPIAIPKDLPPQFHKEYEGYFEVISKEIPGVVCIKTGYEQNPYLPESKVKEYEAYGDPGSETFDLHHYLTAIKGFASTGRKGQILRKAKPISLAEYMALPYREFYGQDFGTASPAALVGVKIHRNTSWCRMINYKPLETIDIGKLYCTLKFNIADEIIADKADPKSYKKLKSGYTPDELSEDDIKKYPGLLAGFNVIPSIGGPDSITYGIDLMRSMVLFYVDDSEEFTEEILNYVFAVDKNGNYTNDPIDDFNHGIDSWRNVIHKHRGKSRVGSQAA